MEIFTPVLRRAGFDSLRTLVWFSRQRAGDKAPVGVNMKNLGELKTLSM